MNDTFDRVISLFKREVSTAHDTIQTAYGAAQNVSRTLIN